MSNKVTAVDSVVMDLAGRYGEMLTRHLLQDIKHENIDSGSAGMILYLLELNRQNPGAEMKERLIMAVDNLLSHCRRTPTNNFSFYAGRAGIIYVLIQCYLFCGNEKWLEEALELIRPANKNYLHSVYTTDYLYDGRSGTLLVLLQLYLLTHRQFLLEYIEQFINKILSNARLTATGICWNTAHEINLKPSCGFAHGAAGINFVLRQINEYCPNAAIEYVVAETDRYIDSCWIPEYDNWGNFNKDIRDKEVLQFNTRQYQAGNTHLFRPGNSFSWANGSVGMNFSDPKNDRREISQAFLRKMVAEKKAGLKDLYAGKAGLGFYFLSAEGPGSYECKELVFQLTNELTAAGEKISLEGGLMHGDLGAVYFLMRATGAAQKDDCLLAPFNVLPGNIPGLNIPNAAVQIRRALLSKTFPRTFNLLQKISPRMIDDYFLQAADNDESNEIARFTSYIDRRIHSGALQSMTIYLKDLFLLEKERFFFQQYNGTFQAYLHTWVANARVLDHLNKPDDLLLKQTVSISPDIKIFHTKWDWSISTESGQFVGEDLLQKHLQNVGSSPREQEYIFQRSWNPANTESCFETAFRLLLHRFDEPKTIHQAMVEIRQYIQSLSPEMLVALLVEIGVSKAAEMKYMQDLVDGAILSKIKTWIHRGILVIHLQ